MSTISGGEYLNSQAATRHSTSASARETSRQTKSAPQTGKPESEDTVEISREARDLLENPPASEPWKPWSIMEYETPLISGSKEEKEFRELMKSVKSQKSEIMSQVTDIFKRHGISQKDFGKVKIEVDGSGKIVVGGVRDAKTAKAIEKSLNADQTLGKKLLQFQHDEKELSKQIKEYTGCTLFELTMTQRGDVNERIRTRVEDVMKDCPPRDEYYWNLAFLGENRDHVVGVQDIYELGFQGAIDFSGEVNTLAEPERNVKKELETMYQKVREEFDKHNADVAEKMKAAGVEITDEMKKTLFLDAANVKITIDNLGAVMIEGLFSDNAENHKKGEDIVDKLAREMLNKTEDNSYHLNIFTSACDTLIQRMADETGDENLARDAKVVAEIANGSVGDVRVSSPQAEAALRDTIQNTVNQMIRDSGIALADPLKIEIDESGKITATNLVAGADSERVQDLLNRINENVKNRKGDKEEENEAKKDTRGKITTWQDGIDLISEQLTKLKKIKEGNFNPTRS